MKRFIITSVAVLAGVLGAGTSMAADSLDQLLNEVKQARSEMSAENKQREQRFQRERDADHAVQRE